MNNLDERSLKKPMCYDPSRKKFIMYDELASGEEKIIDPATLSKEDQKILVIERLKRGPDFTVQSISGPPYHRDDVIQSIVNDEEMGKMSVEAELSMLKDLLKQILK
jgi:hypothetical protein